MKTLRHATACLPSSAVPTTISRSPAPWAVVARPHVRGERSKDLGGALGGRVSPPARFVPAQPLVIFLPHYARSFRPASDHLKQMPLAEARSNSFPANSRLKSTRNAPRPICRRLVKALRP